MKCPYCGFKEDKVVDSRETQAASAIRRRRECLKCGKRFTTYEYIEDFSLAVIKKDGRREPFDRKKVLAGIANACEKRPVSLEKMEEIATWVEHAVQRKSDREVSASRIGELVMEKLKLLDDVAYVRFASVYRQFKDVGQFMEELQQVLNRGKVKPKAKKRRTARYG